MTADELRQASGEMRRLAEAATPGPLEVSHWRERGETTHHTLCKFETRTIRGEERGGFLARQVAMTYADAQGHADFAYFAAWHPVVALAVADWLDGVALFVEAKADEEYFDLDGDPIAAEDTHAIGSALTVARAFLGTTP